LNFRTCVLWIEALRRHIPLLARVLNLEHRVLPSYRLLGCLLSVRSPACCNSETCRSRARCSRDLLTYNKNHKPIVGEQFSRRLDHRCRVSPAPPSPDRQHRLFEWNYVLPCSARGLGPFSQDSKSTSPSLLIGSISFPPKILSPGFVPSLLFRSPRVTSGAELRV